MNFFRNLLKVVLKTEKLKMTATSNLNDLVKKADTVFVLKGNKHMEALKNPPLLDSEGYQLINGKWKQKFPAKNGGLKRKLEENGGDEQNGAKLSKRERTKKNKTERNIEILPQHTEEKYNETETYFVDGYRKVRPYYFTFVTHAKGRWVGRDIWTVFSKEFRAMPRELFEHCITKGLIKVKNYMLRGILGQLRYERIQIVHETDDVLVVNKPSSIPVHPCGRYRHNSVLFILAKEQGYKELHTVHRLDRLTSGILIFAKSAQKSRELELLISGRHVRKEYVCRVNGEFPEGEVVVDQPIFVVSYKIGVCVVEPLEGKQAKTSFERLWYSDGVSVIRCKPETGRMHQIRVHLQYLGFPISNDPLYNSTIFGLEKGKDGVIGKSKEQLILDLQEKHTVDNWILSEEYENSKLNEDPNENTEVDGYKSEINMDYQNKEQNSTEETNLEKEKNSTEKDNSKVVPSNTDNVDTDLVAETKETYFDEHCQDCKRNYKDPPQDTMLIYLHAIKYSGEGWEYSTPLPTWAIQPE